MNSNKNCVDMCARHGRGDRSLFVRKGGASQKILGNTGVDNTLNCDSRKSFSLFAMKIWQPIELINK